MRRRSQFKMPRNYQRNTETKYKLVDLEKPVEAVKTKTLSLVIMHRETDMNEEDVYVDVRSLPLRPPQPLLQPEKAVRRPWHPIMYNHSTIELPTREQIEREENARLGPKEYPHSQRMRNLKRLIADGKVKPTSETLIFFLCNKFAISDERQSKIKL